MRKDKSFVGPSPIYIIATPIGNLSEFSPRAIEILNSVDYVASEDTRVSKKLLSYFNINKPMISCHEHNENEASEKIINLVLEGKKVAFMSDAGYPCVSDPGARLVRNAIAKGIKISTISGPNALLNALVMSGLDTSRFYFHGFLSSKDSYRNKELKSLINKEETLIFYESPHRILDTLKSMNQILGNRNASICRELTKVHEEVIRGTLSELVLLDKEELKGEMVIVIEGNKTASKEINEEEILNLFNKYLDEGLTKKDAIKKISEKTNTNKNIVYDICHK